MTTATTNNTETKHTPPLLTDSWHGQSHILATQNGWLVSQDRSFNKSEIDRINAEHAALVAVAEAAERLESLHSKHSGQPPVVKNADACCALREALNNLATIRGGAK